VTAVRTSSLIGGNPTVTRSGTTVSVDLKATSTVIDWNGFNVPIGATAEFTDGRAVALARNIAVLNRDMSGSNTQILGTLKSDANVAVWVFNPNGILVGSGAKINTGSLVLTTLKPNEANFLAGGDAGGSYGLIADSGTAGDIRVQSGAAITLSSGNRGLIMVAPKVTSAGTLIAGNQDVAFVTASDVTLNYAAGSPLSVTLNKGTAVGGTSQLVTGSVSGRNVVFALASKANVTDALLSVDASVTSASSGDNGIVLSAGLSGNGVTVGSAATETGGVVGIGGAGALRALNDSVTVRATGAVALTGALRAGRDVVVAAGGLAGVAGSVTAGNDYRVTGTGVALGGSTPVVQSAVDVVDIVSTNGTLSGAAGLTLRSNADGAGGNLLTLSTAGTAGGNIVFAKGSSIEGGENRDSDVRIGVGVVSNAVSLGDVSARGLLGAVGVGAYTNGLAIDGAIDLGEVNTRSALSLSSGSALAAGALTSGGAITLNGSGALSLAALDASGDISLNGTGTTTVAGGVVSRGTGSDITIARDGAVIVSGVVTAGGNLTIGTGAANAASIAIDGAVSARDVSFVTTGSQTYGGALTATRALTATAGGAFTSQRAITATNDVTLTAASLALNTVTSTNGDLTLTAATGGIAGFAPAGVRLTAGGAVTATSANSAMVVTSAAANGGVLRLVGGGGVTAGDLSGSNDVVVDAGSSTAIVSGNVSAGRNYTVSGGSVSLGETAAGPKGAATQAARGAVTIAGGAGGITGLDRLTLQSNADGVGSEALELAIADATTGAVAFAPGTTLRGGAASQSDVVIRSGVAEGGVALGNVVARNLLGAVGTAATGNGITRTSALTLGNVALTGPLFLSSAGLSTGALTSGAAVTLNSTAGLTAGAVNAAGTFTAVSSGDLAIATARGDTGVALTSTSGGIDVAGSLTAVRGGVAALANVGTVRLPGVVTAGGDYTVSGGSVVLGGTQAALGKVSVAATAGTLTGTSGLSLTSGSDGRTAKSLDITATGGVAFAADSVLNGGPGRQGAITIDGGANAVTLGNVNGRSLVFNGGRALIGALTAGNVAVVDSLSINGGTAGIRIGSVSVSTGGLSIDAVGGTVDLNRAAITGDLALSGSRIVYGTIDAKAVDLRSVGAGATGIAGGAIDARGPVTITATDGIGGVTTGGITTASSLTVNSVGEIRLGGVDAGGAVNLATLTNPADVLIVNGLTAGGTVTIGSTRDIRAPFITSTGGSLALSAPNGDVTGFLPGTTIQLNTGVGGGYALDVGRSVRLGVLTGGPVSLRANTIDVVAIDVGTNLVKLFADSGDLNIRNGIKAGLVDLRASGAVSVGGTINASDAVTLSGTTGLSFSGVRGLSVTASSGGAITGGSIQSIGAIDLTGASLRVGNLTSSTAAMTLAATSGGLVTSDLSAATGARATAIGNVSVGTVAVSDGSANLASTAGDVRLASGSATGDITLSAGGVAASPGAILAGGTYQVTGGTVELGGVAQEAGGRVTITASNGGISAAQGLALIANSRNGAATDAMLLDAEGAIDLLGSNISVRSGGALGLRAGSGKTVTLGDVDAGLVGGVATAADGIRSVSALFAHDAAVTASTIRSKDLAIALSAGDLSINAVTTTGTARLSTSAGAIRVGTITADAITVDAAGALVGGAYTSTGANSIAGGSIALTTLGSATGSTTATARFGDLTIDAVTAGGTATLSGSSGITVRSITASGLALDAIGTVTGTTFAIKDMASIAGESIQLGNLTSDTGNIVATARRDGIGIDRLSAGGAVTLSAPGNIAIGGLTASTVIANAGGVVSGGDFATEGAASITGLAITLNGVTTNRGPLSVQSTAGDLSIARIDAGGLATLTAQGAITVGGLVADGLTATAGGELSGGEFTTAAAASIAGRSVAVTGFTTVQGPLSMIANGGNLSVGRLSVGGLATLNSTGNVAVDGLAANALVVDAQGMITGGTYAVKGEASIAGRSIRLAALTSDIGAVVATARGDDIAIDRFAAGGAATLKAPGTIAIGGLTAGALTATAGRVLSGGDFVTTGATSIAGDSLTVASVTTTRGPLTATATGGDLSMGRIGAGGLATLTGAGAVRVDSLTADALALDAQGAVTGGTFAAKGSASISGQSIGLAALTSDTGDIVASSRRDGVSIDRLAAGGAASITAPGTIAIAALAANSVNATANGALTGGTFTTAGAASLKGQSIELTGVTAKGTLTANATGGDLAIGLVAADGLATLSGTGGVAVGALTANVLAVDARGAITGGTFATKGSSSIAARSIILAGLSSGAGDIVADARQDGVSIGRLAAGGVATVTAPGTIAIGALTANALTAAAGDALTGGEFTTAGVASLTGRSITLAGVTTAQGTLTANATGGDLSIGLVDAGGLATLSGTGSIAVDSLIANALTMDARGAVSGGTYSVNGAAAVAGQAITLAGLTSAAGDVTATARTGDVAVNRLTAGGAATALANGAVAVGEFGARGNGTITATSGGIRLDTATASALTLKAAGDISGRTAAGASVTTTASDLMVSGDRAVTLASATSAGGATISGGDVRVSGGLGAARALLVQARNALTLGDATAGSTLSLTATNGLTAQALRAGGDTTLKAGSALSAGAIDTGGALSVNGGADVSIASSRTGGTATIDAVGIATLGQMIAGPSLTIRASDARLSGVQRASSVGFENRTGDTSALRLGDGTTADGFQLSDAEIKLVEADALTFRQGAGAVEIGTLAFDADAGRRTVDVLGTGRMTIDGVVSGAGAGRMFRFGGTSASDTDTASAIHVAATGTAGGRLLFDTADLDLRGNRIAVGLGSGFLNLLNDDATVTQVVAGLVGNANSALYNANLGGGAYDPSAPTTVSAHSLTVRYGDYALFQNTGVARTNTGIVLGGTPTAPVNPALSLRPTGPANTFAAFGTINGVGSTAAALLGPNAVSLGSANVSASRINGCVVGSGAGCLTAIVIQPTLQVFSASQADLFGSVADLTVPFDPLVGGSNEELLTGLAALAPRPDTDGCVAGKKESCK
jgi:filamentous hemagglutinin family protein